MARLLYMMSGDAALSSVLPFDSHTLLQRYCEGISNGDAVDILLERMKKYCVEVAHILHLSVIHDIMNMVIGFLMYALDQINAVHANNKPFPDSNPIPNSYNPTDGCAYYFTPSGSQMRQMPTYEIMFSMELQLVAIIVGQSKAHVILIL